MQTKISRRVGASGESRTADIQAPSVWEALEAALDEIEDGLIDPTWEVAAVECRRDLARGRRASLRVTWLTREAIAKKKRPAKG